MPPASQCHTSIAASLIGVHPVASTTVSFRWRGAPSLPSVMSLRTLLRSRSYGPWVTWGVSTHAAVDPVVPDAPADVVRLVVLDDALFDDEPPPHAAAMTPAPRPARSPIAWRRLRRSGLSAMLQPNKMNLAAA